MTQARILRIKKVGDYRAFRRWVDGGRPEEFRRVNLIYGTNGSGKSTIASLFRQAALGEPFDPAPRLEVEVETAGSRAAVSESDVDFWFRVKVFNADYVRENLRFDEVGGPRSESLLTLGKPSVDAEKELASARARVSELNPKLQPSRAAAVAAVNHLENRLSALAGEVVDDLRQSSVATYRGTNVYTKRNVRTLLEGDKSAFDERSTDVASDRAVATSRAMGAVALAERGAMADAAVVDQAQEILRREVAVTALEELKNHEDRAVWVQAGIALHEGADKCLFCGQSLTSERREALAVHFSDALVTLQREADQLVEYLEESVRISKRYQDQIPRDADVYPDLVESLRQARSAYVRSHKSYARSASVLIAALQSKRNNPFHTPVLDPGTTLEVPNSESVSRVVVQHAERTKSHSDEVTRAARRVELFRVAGFRAEYGRLKRDIAAKKTAADTLQQEIRDLSDRIVALQNVSADPVPKADELTRSVARLLGRAELRFTTSSDGKHYAIERDSAPASHLSEGERTTIALLHFLASVRDDVIVGEEPIVIVDDPVSSMDENVLFGASAYLWAELVRKTFASQVFLLTHNFELFRQWIIQLENAKKYVLDGFTIHELRMRYLADSGGAMLRAPQFDPWTTDQRQSRRLRSLYHFLFARVAGAVIEASPELSLAERMDLLALAPNAARKMLESFLSFRFPEHIGNFHGGMEAALKVVDDAATRNHVERYLHAYSHNEEGSVSAVVDPQEATVVLRSLFGMIRAVDPDHFSAMCKALLLDEVQLMQVPASSPSAAQSAGV